MTTQENPFEHQSPRTKGSPARQATLSPAPRKQRSNAGSTLFTLRDQFALAWIGEQYAIRLDHLQRLHASIEGIRDMQTTAIQVNLGMINLNETEVTKKLAAWAAIIAIPTLIAGIYGMNFKGMPEYDWTFGYPLALAMMVGIDVALYLWFKKIRWL